MVELAKEDNISTAAHTVGAIRNIRPQLSIGFYVVNKLWRGQRLSGNSSIDLLAGFCLKLGDDLKVQ